MLTKMIAALMIALLLAPLQAFAQSTDYGPQLTAAELEVQGAISSACNATDACVQLVNSVIPRCQRLQGDPGCWCGNHDPLHFCAICMSNPTDNRTSPEQTAAAIEGHQKYHTLCNAWEAALNASVSAATMYNTAIATSSSGRASPTISAASSGGSKTPIGAIVGGAVGGGAVLIIAILVLLYWMRERDGGDMTLRPSSVSLFSAPVRPYPGYSSPPPQMEYKPDYAAPATSYNGTGMHSPPPRTKVLSYSKYPEPMVSG